MIVANGRNWSIMMSMFGNQSNEYEPFEFSYQGLILVLSLLILERLYKNKIYECRPIDVHFIFLQSLSKSWCITYITVTEQILHKNSYFENRVRYYFSPLHFIYYIPCWRAFYNLALNLDFDVHLFKYQTLGVSVACG